MNYVQWILRQPCPRCGYEVMAPEHENAVGCRRCGWHIGLGFLVNYLSNRHIWVGEVGGPLEPLAGLPLDEWVYDVTVNWNEPVWYPCPVINQDSGAVEEELRQYTLPAGARDIYVAVHLPPGRPTRYTDRDLLPTAGRQRYERWHFQWRGKLNPADGRPLFEKVQVIAEEDTWGRLGRERITLTAPQIQQTRYQEGAFARALREEQEAFHRDIRRDLNRQMADDHARIEEERGRWEAEHNQAMADAVRWGLLGADNNRGEGHD